MCRHVGLDCLNLRSLGEEFGGDHNVSHIFVGMGMDFLLHNQFSTFQKEPNVVIQRVASTCEGSSLHTTDKYHIIM